MCLNKLTNMLSAAENNKAIVRRFNIEIIEQGNLESFHELVAPDVVNHSATLGSSTGPDGMIHFLWNILRAKFTDLQVEILEQIAERDLVTTRKKIKGSHTDSAVKNSSSYQKVIIDVIDIIRIREGKYVDHWGISNFAEVLSQISLKGN